MILDLIASALLLFIVYRRGRTAIELWIGPYDEKGRGLLLCLGHSVGALIALAAVWL